MSKILNIVAVLVAVVAAFVGVFFYTEIPKKSGLFTWWAGRDPKLIGMTPAFLYGVKWNYTLEELRAHGVAGESTKLKGQRAVVTGASSGIGYAMATELAKLGAEVVMACRNPPKCQDRADAILREHPGSTLVPMTIDTSSFKSVRAFADAYMAKYGSNDNGGAGLDMLFLNAGTAHNPTKSEPCVPLSDEDQIEYVFQTNYLGHHLLYRLLEPALLDARHKPATVVQTSSSASYGSYSYRVATDLDTLNGCKESVLEKKTGENLSYGQSKLAQIVWAKEVTRRLAVAGNQDKILVNAFHPGFVTTEIFDKIQNVPPFMMKVVRYAVDNGLAWNITEGALTGLYLGVEKEHLVEHDVRGKYYHPQSIKVENPLANDEDLQTKLWDFSDAVVKDFL